MHNRMDQESFDFSELVSKEFIFLHDEFNYELIHSSENLVQYRLNDIVINIMYDPYSYEVEFDITRLNKNKPDRYGFIEIIKSADPDYKGQMFFQASGRTALEQCLRIIAQTLQKYCRQILLGDNDAFYALEKSARLISKGITKKYSVEPVKNEALLAWESRNYGEVVRLYQLIESELTDVEKRRLTYARKMEKKSRIEHET